MQLMFNLTVPPDRRRSDVDGYLSLKDHPDWLPFELKSTTRNSISTVRDFGPEHVAKWRNLHWIFAFYEKDAETLKYCYYASPADMRDWVEDKERYIRPDMVLAEHSVGLITDETLTTVLGPADTFTKDDAKLLMKKQWSAQQYKDATDLPRGKYSREQMLRMLQERLGYVIRRGATLNNPHISESYFTQRKLPKITEDHAATLRALVRRYLDSGAGKATLDSVVAAQAKVAETDTPMA